MKMALQGKDGFGNWTGTGGAVVCWRACVRACSTRAVLVQHRLLLCRLGSVINGWWRKCVQLAAMHAHGAFSVLVNELYE